MGPPAPAKPKWTRPYTKPSPNPARLRSSRWAPLLTLPRLRWKARLLTANCSAIACATVSRKWAENSHPSFCMPLPETIAVRFTEEDAGYVTVRPVVKQSFRLAELADMVVSVTGKNGPRVQQIFRAGTVVYNGYRYWWDGFASTENEVAGLLAPFPDDNLSLHFNPAQVTAVSLEIGGGAQRSLVKITRREASAKRLWHKQNPWEIFLKATQNSTPRYDNYSHAERADVYRLHLSPEMAASLMREALKASPRSLRKKLAALRPPAPIQFFVPLTNSVDAQIQP